MIVIGLILIVAALGAGAWLFLASQHLTNVTYLDHLGVRIGFTPLALLIIGAGTMLALLLGLALIRAAIARRGRLRRDRKENERLAAEQRATQEREATRRLEQERSNLAARRTTEAPHSVTEPVAPSEDSVGWRTGDTTTEIPPPPPPNRG